MTIEKELDYKKELDVNRINQEPIPLNQNELIDANSDINVSMKMVDEDGDIVLLIEAGPRCIYKNEPDRCMIGCFIYRFEYVKDFLQHPCSIVLDDFLHKFECSVNLNQTPTAQDKLVHFQFLWAEQLANNKCLIADLLHLPLFLKDGDHIIYKKKLNNR